MTDRTNPVHLDRLSALLEGAQARIECLTENCPWPTQGTGLNLFIPTETDLEDGAARARDTRTDRAGAQPPIAMPRPALLVSQGDPTAGLQQAISLHGLRLHIALPGPAGPLLAAQFARPLQLSEADSAQHALGATLTLLCDEARSPRCGQPAMLRRAGEILFITLLRYLIAHPEHGGELFRGLADPRLARALVALHTEPAFPWTLEGLADTAGMSRTAFATAFRTCMQQTPGRYLADLRLSLARQASAQGKTLKEAARLTGYASASALSRALARTRAAHPERHP